MKIFVCTFLLLIPAYSLVAQGCSDAGFCTAGDFFNRQKKAAASNHYKNEIEISLNYATHIGHERFFQPQVSYRLIKKNNAFFEFRLPLNYVKNTGSGISNTGIGDITTTYNHSFQLDKNNKIDYSLGLKISLSDASKKAANTTISYPMYLQNGLGTTDLIAIANYTIVKYLSIGTGLQLPLFQYNNHKIIFSSAGATPVNADGYRRKPDALLKLTGHYQAGKLKMNGSVLGIFHLTNDYYNTANGKYILQGSKGSTINLAVDFNYPVGKKASIGLLFAQPVKTRDNIPDGLARSRIISPKLTIGF